MFVNGKEIFRIKVDNKNVNFQTQFYLGSVSNGFGVLSPKKYLWMEVFTILSVDCNSVGKSDILTIHKKLMIRSNI